MSRTVMAWIGLAFGAVSFLAILGAVGWSMISNSESIEDISETVNRIELNGPLQIQDDLDSIKEALRRIEERQGHQDRQLNDIQLEVVRTCGE